MPKKKETPTTEELHRKPVIKLKAAAAGACKKCACTMYIEQPMTPNECGREGCGHTILEHT